jgi:hypothetical protein
MYSLFAQHVEPRWLEFLEHPETLIFLIPIVGILVGGIITITKTMIRHRERMAMIERGMHPDSPRELSDPQEKV